MASAYNPDQARLPPALQLPTPPVTKFKIALCQLSVTTDKERNIAHTRKAIEEAAEKGAQLILLPMVGRIGIGICYDIRFQELAAVYAARELLIIRYLNNTWIKEAMSTIAVLSYVATCSPARDVGAGYIAWGHSTLVGPFGEVLATTEHEEAIIISEIDYSAIDLRRSNLPLEKQRTFKG